MRVRILGSAAGGGFPQWNCSCTGCEAVRGGSGRARPRTQECVAVSADGDRWVLLNASPEIRGQIEAFPPLHPRPPRRSPIAGVVLTNGDLDHCLGLLSLREWTAFEVAATAAVREAFTGGNPLARVLDAVTWRELPVDAPQTVALGGLEVVAFPVPGKPPRYLEDTALPAPGDNVALKIRAPSGRVLLYAPSVGALSEPLVAAIAEASCVLLDGTFWSSDELGRHGLSSRTAEDMAHLPVGGALGSMRALRGTAPARRIYVHLNNTNPLLLDDSPERAEVEAAGWEVAWDGLEVEL